MHEGSIKNRSIMLLAFLVHYIELRTGNKLYSQSTMECSPKPTGICLHRTWEDQSLECNWSKPQIRWKPEMLTVKSEATTQGPGTSVCTGLAGLRFKKPSWRSNSLEKQQLSVQPSYYPYLQPGSCSLGSPGSHWSHELERLSCCIAKESKEPEADREARPVLVVQAIGGPAWEAALMPHHQSVVTRGLDHDRLETAALTGATHPNQQHTTSALLGYIKNTRCSTDTF